MSPFQLKTAQTLMTDKSNQIATLQRQIDQQQVQQMSSQEALRKEQEQVFIIFNSMTVFMFFTR